MNRSRHVFGRITATWITTIATLVLWVLITHGSVAT